MKKKLLINIFCLFCTVFASNEILAQTANNNIDATGDIAFTAYVTNGTNSLSAFAFILLDNCPVNQSIGFVDDEWTGSSFAPISEGEIIWTNNTGATINKGTVIKIAASAINTAWPSASVNIGSIVITGSFTTGNGDQIFAMTGSRSSYGTFLAFVGGITTSTLCFQGTPFGSGCGSFTTNNLTFNGQYGTNVTAGSAYTATPACNGTAAQCNTMINTAASWGSPGTFANAAAFFANTPIPNSFTGSALPIELTRFEGNQKGGYNLLTWQTATEKNNAYFDIERSEDGKEFRSIGQVKGKGNTSSGFNYSFMDEKPAQGNNYYRLKQTDYDGSFEYSHILTVKNSVKQERCVISPNPVSDVLNVEYLGKKNELRTIEIYDILGNLIYNIKNDLQENEINTSSLQSGTYIWKISQEGKVQTGKFMKL